MHPFRNPKHRTCREPWGCTAPPLQSACRHGTSIPTKSPWSSSPHQFHPWEPQSPRCKGDGLRGHVSTRKMLQYHFIVIVGIQQQAGGNLEHFRNSGILEIQELFFSGIFYHL